MSIPIYQVENFGFNYPQSHYNLKLNGKFTINQGECILIQGASGSGKSTLLAALKGLIPHLINGKLSGKIIFNHQDITTFNEKQLLGIGYLQQNPDSQLICSDVYSELAFGLENQGFTASEIESKITRIAQDFKLDNLLTYQLNQLSGGEKQKVNLLAILLMQPQVLLLDEPTAFLDPESAHEIIMMLQQYIQHSTVVIVEHNHYYLRNIISRVINISNDGQISEQSSEQSIWNQTLPKLKSAGDSKQTKQALIELRQLNFAYSNNRKLLNNLNLTINSGEIIAITGKNGSGKSSLLKLIAGIIKTPGQIFWQQQDIATINYQRLWSYLTLLWQNPEAHFIYNSVDEELEQNNKILALFNLVPQRAQNPYSLSEGQKRRLSLAIALNLHPQLILLDEPTFGQDYEHKLQLAQLIMQLKNQGMSFVMVSHDQDFIDAIADRRYHLAGGELSLC
ncbi:MAG: energy-coupling factor ABC transporter ATP-binding protein [Burkholderiales bacterium]|nr:energy-coupling factor ABC transporter ATP-binding protein [Burkholderiales bacterium]